MVRAFLFWYLFIHRVLKQVQYPARSVESKVNKGIKCMQRERIEKVIENYLKENNKYIDFTAFAL